MNIQKIKSRLPFKCSIVKTPGVVYTKSNYADTIKEHFKINSLFLMSEKEKKALYKYFIKYFTNDIKIKAEKIGLNEFSVILHDIPDLQFIQYVAEEEKMYVLFNLSYSLVEA